MQFARMQLWKHWLQTSATPVQAWRRPVLVLVVAVAQVFNVHAEASEFVDDHQDNTGHGHG